MVAPETQAGPTLWVNPTAPGSAPENANQGTAAQINAARHAWEEAVLTFCTFNTVQQALKKQIITVFETMYLDILDDDMVGFAKISAREMLDHLFMTYGNITAADLESNFKHMRHVWNPKQPIESLLKQIQDCSECSKAGGVIIGHQQHINVGYAKIFSTGPFMSACHRWNEKPNIEKTWSQFKSHFTAAHRQHKQMQGEYAATSGYHAANAYVGQTEDQIEQATIGALDNLATATATNSGVVATLTEANARLTKQLEDNASELRDLKSLLKKERNERRGQRTFNPYPNNY
jgi:hypothetical protein